MTACFLYEAVNCVRVLLKHGADVNAKCLYPDFFYSFQFSRTQKVTYESFQLFFLYGLKYDASRPYADTIYDHKTRNFYFDWPFIIFLYCLEKRNKFFVI